MAMLVLTVRVWCRGRGRAPKFSDAVPQASALGPLCSSTGGRAAGARPFLPYFYFDHVLALRAGYLRPSRERFQGSADENGWMESAIEAEHASARKLFNSSLP